MRISLFLLILLSLVGIIQRPGYLADQGRDRVKFLPKDISSLRSDPSMLSIQRKSGEPESRARISLSIPSIPSVVQIKGEAKEGYPGERLLSE